MATSAITNTLTDPSGTALADVVVVARLKPGNSFRTSDNSEVSTIKSTTTNGSGAWSLTLEENANIVPAGTYYEIEEQIPVSAGGAQVWRIQVGASDATLRASLLSTLPTDAISGNITQDAADARYVQLAALPFIDAAQEYGVTGDGVDSTTALNNAITALPTSGGTILLPPGIIKITAITTDKRNLELVGQGSPAWDNTLGVGATQILVSGANVGITWGDGTNLFRGPTFRNIYFKAEDATVTGGVRLRSPGSFYFENCAFSDFTGASSYGLFIDGGSGSALTSYGSLVECRFNKCKTGCKTVKVNGIRFIAGTFDGASNGTSITAGTIGLDLQSGDTATVLGTNFQGWETNIDCQSDSHQFIGCRHEIFTTAMKIRGAGNAVVGGTFSNFIIGATGTGIDIIAGASSTYITNPRFSSVGTNLTDAGTNTRYIIDDTVSFRDVNLYRTAADNWKTDDRLDAVGILVAKSGVASQTAIGDRGPASESGISFGTASDTVLYRSAANTLALGDADNLAVGTVTGTKIGTATTQKLGFFNATPVVQPAANADTSGATLGQLETEVNELKATLRSLGLLAT